MVLFVLFVYEFLIWDYINYVEELLIIVLLLVVLFMLIKYYFINRIVGRGIRLGLLRN